MLGADWSAPFVNDGASLTAVTVIVKVCGAEVSTPPFAVPPLSLAVTVTVAEPLASAAGVKVSVPFELTAGCTENSELRLLVTVKLTVCPDSSAGPDEMPMAQPAKTCAPASSLTVWFAPFVNYGASLTAVTVIVKVCGGEVSLPPFAVPPLSFAVTVTVALPLAFDAGV